MTDDPPVERVAHDRPDPEDDPFACDICGHYLSELKRLRGDLCYSCQREHQPSHDMAYCMGCGRYASTDQMEAIDVTPPDEYYLKVEYLCRDCSGGEVGGE